MNPNQLTKSLKQEAERLGFDISGACAAVMPTGFHQFVDWLDQGFAGEMNYLEDRKEAYEHPSHVLPGAMSILMLGLNYQTAPAVQSTSGTGRIARYAWSNVDYHDLVHKKLKQLKRFVKDLDPSIGVRGVVDTAPLLEREFAELAGIGWRAKNTLLINKTAGSWFFLAALLLDVPLQYDEPMVTNHCGTCTACIDACPTDAFVQPHVLDATQCISYLTIEHRTAVPTALRSKMQDWILGCDICQEVCPVNRDVSRSSDADLKPKMVSSLELIPLLSLTQEEFSSRFKNRPIKRAKLEGLKRNACVALGNAKHISAVSALGRVLLEDTNIVKQHAAWALGRIGGMDAKSILSEALATESDHDVQREIILAIDSIA